MGTDPRPFPASVRRGSSFEFAGDAHRARRVRRSSFTSFMNPFSQFSMQNATSSSMMVKSAEKGARKSAQMGATYAIDYSVREDAVNKILQTHP